MFILVYVLWTLEESTLGGEALRTDAGICDQQGDLSDKMFGCTGYHGVAWPRQVRYDARPQDGSVRPYGIRTEWSQQP